MLTCRASLNSVKSEHTLEGSMLCLFLFQNFKLTPENGEMASLKSIEWQPIEALAQLELELEAVFITFVPPPLVAKFISLLVPLFGPIALPHLKRVRKPVGVKKDPNALSLSKIFVYLTHCIK